ncbi:sensor histidine kinase [Haliscomenobacter hydrossis]|uniref:Signal transduction histidine kinase n=1 Tax=Haliscomenobacter hydrossis (strain ATCC 27775 / DSM 1100 / LMG 10767 / O) TaxID=760192 RepID=F4L129_HALH1|nr:histidine kinase [Haliscomenobacter hydrossis]AEE51616.1 putative signal transduction histidine kinase [Haliscomenobacter hydrossis DSM 1100]
MSKKWIEILGNIVFWLLSGWVVLTHFSIQPVQGRLLLFPFYGRTLTPDETDLFMRSSIVTTKLFVILLIAMLLFYANFINIFVLDRSKKYGKIFLRSLILLVVAIASFHVFQNHYPHFQKPVVNSFLSGGILFFYFTVSCAYSFSKIWILADTQNQKLEMEKTQAELNLLRSQLHPHFLFNVLNNLLSMVNQKENPALAKAFERLSGLLRYVVVDSAHEKIPIWKEIEFIRNFAELHALRFEKEELDFQLEVLGTNDKQLIEPAIFIPFIENAFKYGLEPEKNSKIVVVFDLTDGATITFRCINQIHETMQQLKGSGLGIESSKKRLNLVYPHRHHLSIQQNGDFEVLLEIYPTRGGQVKF